MATKDIIESLNQLRLSNINCDVIFEIGPKSFPAHRVVLMARLEHFRNMFTADMREKKELVIQFDPMIIYPDFFGILLDYVYTSKISFTLENFGPIYKAADYFCFDELTTKAKEHLKSSISIENAILYRNISVEFNIESLEDFCEQFIIDNLSSDVIKDQLIPTLSLEELMNFVGTLKESRRLEEVFHYSLDWVLFDEPYRIGTLPELLMSIPLESLSFRFLKQTVSQNALIKRDNGSVNLVLEAVINLSDSCDRNELPVDCLYAIGGKDGGRLSSVSQYDKANRKWISSTPMPSQRSHFGCAAFGEKIYVCGGYCEQANKNHMMVFDTTDRIWERLAPMKHSRANCAAAVLNGQIYVAGGSDNNGRELEVVERYCIETDQWSEVLPMFTRRSELELVELNGFLYAIGGHNGSDALSSVERYDPQTEQWTAMASLNNRYNSFGSAIMNGYIYVLGRNKCEVYYPADDRWMEMPAPRECGYGVRLAAYGGKLYAIGGRVGEIKEWKGSKAVQVFDMQARIWQSVPDMDIARCFHGVAVVTR